MMQPEAPMGEAPAQAHASGPQALIEGLHKGMMKLGQLLEKSGAPAKSLEALQGAIESFQSAVEMAMGGDEGGDDEKEAPAVSSMEAGANPNARPMG